MPVAVIASNTDKFDLKSLEGAFVVVRRMNYGESLKRSGIATKFLVGGNAGNKDFTGELDIQSEAVALWDFANLIVEHNLEDLDGTPLNFKNPEHVKKLDGPIGTEVGKIIDKFNSAEDEDEVKNF